MRQELASICLILGLRAGSGVTSFQQPSVSRQRIQVVSTATSLYAAVDHDNGEAAEQGLHHSRRRFLAGAGLVSAQWSLLSNQPVWAVDDASGGGMTKQLFNEDGSLKEGEVEEAKVRKVDISWSGLSESSGKYLVSVDGKSSDSGSTVRLSYKVPEKWQQQDNGYFDKATTGSAKACEKITVYRAPGQVTPERLAKAATIGIGEALYVTDELSILKKADLLAGKTRKQGDLKFYDFDMASAPKECEMSPENLGLGFCPFDTIYLLSAVVVEDALYVLAVECDKSEWKVANADLKRVRSSFSIDSA